MAIRTPNLQFFLTLHRLQVLHQSYPHPTKNARKSCIFVIGALLAIFILFFIIQCHLLCYNNFAVVWFLLCYNDRIFFVSVRLSLKP